MPQVIEVPGMGQVEFPDGMSDADISAAIKKNLGPTPKKNMTLPANAGLANFASSVAGLPMDTLQNAYNLFKAGIGVAQNKLTGTEPLPLTSGLPGTSESIRNALRATGEPGLSPDNPNPQSKLGTIQYDLTSRGGFIPGGALPAVSSMIAEKTLGPQYGPVGALLPQAAITAYNAVRAPQLAKQQAQNAVRDATLKEGQDAGYVVPPSATGQEGIPGFISRRLESVGGKAAIGQEAAVRNQKVTNDLARKAVELPENSAISVQALDAQRSKFSAPYREVSKLDPEAARALEDLKQARFDANANYRYYEVNPNPEVLAKAKEFQTKADSLEKYLQDIASNAGKPDLVNELRQARQKIAKTYDVERALNVATGDVSARVLGGMVDKGKPLSGGLGTAGKFQQAFPSYMREGEKIPTPGVSKSEALASLLFGLGGYQALGPAGVALAATPLASGPARSLVLSGPYQGLTRPSYQPALTPTPNPQLLYQLGILAQPQ